MRLETPDAKFNVGHDIPSGEILQECFLSKFCELLEQVLKANHRRIAAFRGGEGQRGWRPLRAQGWSAMELFGITLCDPLFGGQMDNAAGLLGS